MARPPVRKKCHLSVYDLSFPWQAERRWTATLRWSDRRFYKPDQWPEFEGQECWVWAERDHRGRLTVGQPCDPPPGWQPLMSDPYYAAQRRWTDWVHSADPDKGPEPPPPPGGWRSGGGLVRC